MLKKVFPVIAPTLGFLFVTALMYPDIWLGRRDLYFNDLIEGMGPERRIHSLRRSGCRRGAHCSSSRSSIRSGMAISGFPVCSSSVRMAV
jgi:hypothetical protein